MPRRYDRRRTAPRGRRGRRGGCRADKEAPAAEEDCGRGRSDVRLVVGLSNRRACRWAGPWGHFEIEPIVETSSSTENGSRTKAERRTGKIAKLARRVQMSRNHEDGRLAVSLAELLGELRAHDRGQLVVGDREVERFGGDGQRDRAVYRLEKGPAAMAKRGRNEQPDERLVVHDESHWSELVVGIRPKVGLDVYLVPPPTLDRQCPAGPVLRSHMNLCSGCDPLDHLFATEARSDHSDPGRSFRTLRSQNDDVRRACDPP